MTDQATGRSTANPPGRGDAPASRRRFDAFWLFLLLVPPWLLFPNLGASILWQDEAETATLAQRIVMYGYPLADDGTSPLDKYGHSLWSISDQRLRPDHSYVDIDENGIWIWTSWFGNYVAAGSMLCFDALGLNRTMEQQTLAARFPFALGAWLTLGVMYVALLDISGNRRLSRLAVMLLTFSVPYLLFARQCRSYPFLSMYTLLQAWGYIRMTRHRRHGFSLFCLGGAGSYYTFFPTMMGLTGALGLHALFTHRPGLVRGMPLRDTIARLRAAVWMRYIIGCVMIAALTIPFFVYTRSWDRDYDNSGVPIRESWSRLAASMRAYLVHAHTSVFPFVLVVPAAWVSRGWLTRRALTWMSAGSGLAAAGACVHLSLTVGKERGLHFPMTPDALRVVAGAFLEFAPVGALTVLLAALFLLLLSLLALPGAPSRVGGAGWKNALKALTLLLAVAGFLCAIVLPAGPISLGIVLGGFLAVGLGLFVWSARTGSRTGVLDGQDSNWKQAVAISTGAIIFSAAALANHPFYRYLMGALPLLALGTAGCILRLTRQRLAPVSVLLLLLIGCELVQYGPLYAARKLLLDPWRRARVEILAEEFRKQGVERPMDKAYDESYYEATRFGHLATNGYTWTMLTKNGRLDHWLEYQVLEFPLANLWHELNNDYEGPIEDVIRHLKAHAAETDLITTAYEHFPLRYYTNLLILRTRDLTERFGNRLPDWIVFQHWDYDLGLPKFVYDRAKDPNYYERVELPAGAAALQWDNIPEPAWHHFRTVDHKQLKKPVFLRLKPEAKARVNAQVSGAATRVETLP